MICPECGVEVDEKSNVCNNCGYVIKRNVKSKVIVILMACVLFIGAVVMGILGIMPMINNSRQVALESATEFHDLAAQNRKLYEEYNSYTGWLASGYKIVANSYLEVAKGYDDMEEEFIDKAEKILIKEIVFCSLSAIFVVCGVIVLIIGRKKKWL